MRTLVVVENVSIDGVMQAPARPAEDTRDVEAVRELRADGDGSLVVLGSADLAQQLAAAGLVDEYVITRVPLVLGQGRRLFGDTPAHLEPVRVQAFDNGVTVGHYRVTR